MVSLLKVKVFVPGLWTVTVGCAENPLPVNAVGGTEIVAKL
jgi:hypothetical protein